MYVGGAGCYVKSVCIDRRHLGYKTRGHFGGEGGGGDGRTCSGCQTSRVVARPFLKGVDPYLRA